MEQSVEENNEKLTLSQIKADTLEAAKNLTEIYAEHAREKESLAVTRNTHQAEFSAMELDRADLAQKHLTIDQRTKEMAGREIQHKNEVEVAVEQKKAALKELGQVNGWIDVANIELARKKKEIEAMDEKLAGKDQLEKDLITLREDIATEEKKRDAVRLETSLLLDNTSASVEKEVARAKEATETTERAETRLAEAVQQETDARNRTQQIKEEGEIYLKRVEEKYNEAFPDSRVLL